MPIAKHRDNLSDLVEKAAKRRDRVNVRKRKMSTVHVSTPMQNEVSKLKQQRKVSRTLIFENTSVDSIDDESAHAHSPNSSSKGDFSAVLEGEETTDDRLCTEAYIYFLARISFMSTYCYIFVENSYWKTTRMLFTGLAIYTLAAEVSLFKGQNWKFFYYVSNAMVNSFFLFDGLLKMSSFFGYLKIEERFSTKNNIFNSLRRCGIIDFSIASLCFYFASSRVGNWLKLVRVMFIALFSIQQLSSLDVLMSGIGFGLHSVFYTWLLLVLVFIVYGAAGVTFYAESDPYNFGTIALSMWTFFQISTLEDWIEVMRLNYYGCDSYPMDYYPGPEPIQINHYGRFYLPVCTNPKRQPLVSMCLFFSFVVIVGFVLMSLTIAAVTAGINDRLDNLQKEELREELSGLNHYNANHDDKTQTKHLLSATGRLSRSVSNLLRQSSQGTMDGHFSADPALLRLMLFQALNVKKKTDISSTTGTSRLRKNGSHQAMVVKPSTGVLEKMNSGDDSPEDGPPRTNAASNLDSKIVKIDEVNENASSRNTLTSSSPSLLGRTPVQFLKLHLRMIREELSIQKLSLMSRNISSHNSYNIVTNLFILFGAGFELNSLQEDAFAMGALEMPVNVALQVVFTIDIIIKVLATYPQYANFWRNKWNRFDVGTVFLLWVAMAFNFPGLIGRLLQLLRVLRIFRILKLISKIPELHVIMMSIGSSLRALMYIVALMFIFFFHFAVAGIYLFEENDPFHFEGLVRAITTLFQIATLDNWASVARISMLGCDNTEYDLDPPCTNPQALGWIAAWYFIIFIILGVMVLLSLFVGVIITSMELLKEGLKEEREVLAKVRNLQHKYNISDSSVEHLLEIFDMIDVGSNGKLTLDELKPVLEIVSVTPVQQFEMFVEVDTDRSGQIDFSEFCELIQLIGELYIQNEEKKGAKIIRRTKTSRRINIKGIVDKRGKGRAGSNDNKYVDNASDAGSEISGMPMLLRGGSSASIVPIGNDWSDKSTTKPIHDFEDDDLDLPLDKPEQHKPTGDRPRTNGGLWALFDAPYGNDMMSPLETSPPLTARDRDHTVGHASGTMSPIPSALNLLRLQQTEHMHKPETQPYQPQYARSHIFQSRIADDNGDHHFQLRGHTASNKLKLLQGGARPGSATNRPSSGGPHRPKSATRRGSADAGIDAERAVPPSTVQTVSGDIELHKEKAPANVVVEKGGQHKKLGQDFTLADISVHSMKNVRDFSMFGAEKAGTSNSDVNTQKPALSPPVTKGDKAQGDLALEGVDSRKYSNADLHDAPSNIVDHGNIRGPPKFGELNAESVGSEDCWSVGASNDPTYGISGKVGSPDTQ